MKVVNIDKFIVELQSAKCDYWNKQNKKNYGHTIERVIDIMLDCLDDSEVGWGEPNINQLEKNIEKIQRIYNISVDYK